MFESSVVSVVQQDNEIAISPNAAWGNTVEAQSSGLGDANIESVIGSRVTAQSMGLSDLQGLAPETPVEAGDIALDTLADAPEVVSGDSSAIAALPSDSLMRFSSDSPVKMDNVDAAAAAGLEEDDPAKMESDSIRSGLLDEPIPGDSATRATIASYVRRMHAAIALQDTERTRLAWRLGAALETLKTTRRHGATAKGETWQTLVKRECGFSYKTADKYIEVKRFFSTEDDAGCRPLQAAYDLIKSAKSSGRSGQQGTGAVAAEATEPAEQRGTVPVTTTTTVPDGHSASKNSVLPERITARLERVAEQLEAIDRDLDLMVTEHVYVTVEEEVADGAQRRPLSRYDAMSAACRRIARGTTRLVEKIKDRSSSLDAMRNDLRTREATDTVIALSAIMENNDVTA